MANLKTKICDIEFPNPIWTAAGPASANAEMLSWAARGGAGGLVTKSISLKPARVPIPNISSPFSGSLLNAELWSECDYQNFINNELPKMKSLGLPLIVSVGYSPEELEILGKALDEKGLIDAIEFSIHYIGKDINNLKRTALALKKNVVVPVFAKLSPSVYDLKAVIQALDNIVDGYIAINSVGPALDFNIENLQPYLGSKDGRGWLSGRAILPIGLHFVASIYVLSEKPVIGVGGISNFRDVVKYIMAGASAVQVCSLAVIKGQDIYGKLAQGLSDWMDKHDYSSIESLRGAFHRKPPRKLHWFRQGIQLYPVINMKKCNLCNLCIKSCLHQAIQFKDNIFLIDRLNCVSCGLCISVCPKSALQLVEYEEI